MKNTKKIAGLLIIIGLALVGYATYLELSPTFGEKEVARYFHHNNTEYIHQIAFIGMCMIIIGMVTLGWKHIVPVMFLCVTQIGFAQQSDNSLLGYTTKNDTLIKMSGKDIRQSDKKEFSRTKSLVAFYKATEKKENRAGRPFRPLKDNGLQVFWRNMPVFVLQRERKEGGKRIIYDIHVVAFEQLSENTTTWQWVIIQ